MKAKPHEPQWSTGTTGHNDSSEVKRSIRCLSSLYYIYIFRENKWFWGKRSPFFFFFKAYFQLLSEEDIRKSHFATLTESRQ